MWGATFTRSDLSGANLAGARARDARLSFADLRDANLAGTYLRNAELLFADLRGARRADLNQVEMRNTMLPDGSMAGLDLRRNERLVVRDHRLPINVTRTLNLARTSTLEMRFEDANWGSTIRPDAAVRPNAAGTLALNLTSDAAVETMKNVTFSLFDWKGQPPRGKFDRISYQPGVKWDTHQLYTTGTVRLQDVVPLVPGDASRDFIFDATDLVRVLQGGKYLTGEPATWGEGDWNGGPGGWWASPPAGDGVFDQLDIVSALAGGKYLTGPYLALDGDGKQGDGRTSVVYNPDTGQLGLDVPAATRLTSISIDSRAGIFTGSSAVNLGGSFDNTTDRNIFKATFGSSFGSLRFGHVAQPGLPKAVVRSDLTVVGSLGGGGELRAVDLVYVPEPSTVILVGVGLFGLLAAWPRKAALRRA